MGMSIGTTGISSWRSASKGADDMWDGQHAVWLFIHVMPYRFRE